MSDKACKVTHGNDDMKVIINKDDSKIRELLSTSKVIAVVGLSPKEDRPSNIVSKYMIEKGYEVIPVNPGYDEILGRKSYKSLSEIPVKVDIVNVFRRSEEVLPVVEEAVKLNPKCIWLQLGIENEDAKKLAEEKGIFFVQNKCIKIEHSRLF